MSLLLILLKREGNKLMPREIKFRAWLAEKDYFNEPGMYGPFNLWDIEWGREEANVWCHEGKEIQEPAWGDLIIMQYTEVKDRNGKEIYEGDIIDYPGDLRKDQTLVVKYVPGFYIFGPYHMGDSEGHALYSGLDIEVIGNIYENPELMKERKVNEN